MPRRKKTITRILNCLPSQKTERDWTFRNAMAASYLSGTGQIPEEVDLRADWWDIGDQGATGSCVGWAAAEGLFRYHFTRANRIQETDHLSVRFIWMAAKETDTFTSPPTTFIEPEGTSIKSALDIARKYGTVKEEVLPFHGGLYQNDAETFYATASQLKIAAYFNLGANQSNWRTWLATKGPIITRLGVDATWDNATLNQGNLDIYQPDTVRGGHAILIVGYTPNRFIIRNSWGADWGDHGFAYASLDYAAAAFTEAYGISL